MVESAALLTFKGAAPPRPWEKGSTLGRPRPPALEAVPPRPPLGAFWVTFEGSGSGGSGVFSKKEPYDCTMFLLFSIWDFVRNG